MCLMCAVTGDIIMSNMDSILIIVVDKGSRSLGSHVPKEQAKPQKLKIKVVSVTAQYSILE